MTGMEIAYLVAMIAGTGMTYKANKDAATRQTAAINRDQDRQDELQENNRDLLLETIKKYEPEKRMEARDLAETKATDSLTSALTKDREGGTGDISATSGKVSKTYTTDLAKRKVDQLDKSSVLASIMGKVRAPTDLRFEEGLDNSDSASRAGILSAFMKSRATTDQGLIQRAGMPDAGQMLIGDLLKTGGSAGMMSGGPATGTDPFTGKTIQSVSKPTGFRPIG